MREDTDYQKIMQLTANAHAADVYFMNALIIDAHVDTFIDAIRRHKASQNCVLFLTTYGGSADAAFRLVRAIQRHYRDGEFILYVLGRCKSAGTLIALGANKIIMGDFGEFGPLDVQLQKQNEFFSHESGMNHVECISNLHDQLFTCFCQSFTQFTQIFQNAITTRMAAKLAKEISLGLFTPISAKIDPVKLADTYRAIAIAQDYAIRISCVEEEQVKPIIVKLIQQYHNHGFVIDYEEAKTILSNVEFLSEEKDKQFKENILPLMRDPQEQAIITWIASAQLSA
jgi:hypothetical protein